MIGTMRREVQTDAVLNAIGSMVIRYKSTRLIGRDKESGEKKNKEKAIKERNGSKIKYGSRSRKP
jgi:hypothetical protein